ncbi:uncharacterized protein LOC134861770 isoform X6 [Eleginops maclovinus]|uniref:uncharacterized protein LOC134861770 isoform X6 n=1 Tax=Eleginops maclovinus TaxID=56733 RepID=UPI00307FEB67
MSTNAGDGASGSHGDNILQSARRLVQLLSSSGQGAASGGVTNQHNREQRQTESLQTEMTRSFPGIFTRGRGKRRFPTASPVPAKRSKPLDVVFYLLPKQCEKTPKEQEQLVHMRAGLGRRTARLDESTTHEELCDALKVLFPKLGTVTGGWLLCRSSGGWGSRLSLVAPDDTGYTGMMLKSGTRGAKNLLIAPIQEELSTNPLPLTDEAFNNMPKAACQKCEVAVPLPLLIEHIKTCNVIDVDSEDNLANVDISLPEERKCWLTVSDPTKAISQCAESFRRIHEAKSPLLLSMDIRESPAEQDMALVSFYKRPNVEWGRPLNCRLEGDTAIGHGVTRFFFSTCMEKLRPGFASILLEGGSTLSDKDKQSVQDLAYAWDLPSLTDNNRRWLFEKLLIHAVIGRVTRQIKQLRRGIKETPMWTLVTQRPDTVALLFPKDTAGNVSAEVLLQRITWPREDDNDDEDCSVETKCRMSGYLRQFIANATPTELTNLVKFWTGWEVLQLSLSLEVVEGRYLTASTCFETLRIPGHYKDYMSFKHDILACICTCHTGFGLV